MDAVRTGRAVIPELRGKPAFEYMADEPELDAIFNDAMTNMSGLAIAPVIAGYDFSRYPTIVDVAGGHGRFLAEILNATPQARGILFDQPHVVADAPALLEQYQVADRVKVAEGSFFDAVTEAGDAYLLKHIIHRLGRRRGDANPWEHSQSGRRRQACADRGIRHPCARPRISRQQVGSGNARRSWRP